MTVSIVIPTYNGKRLLEKNLPAVLAATGQSEVIVVDDASEDGTYEWIKKNYPQIKTIRNENNLRFGESCNRGVKKVRGKIVVLLNSDVAPQKDFLRPITDDFKDKNMFAVGCKEINVEEGRQIAGGRGVSAFKRGLMIHWRPENQESKQTMWLSGGSMAVKKELWLRLGGFDNLFRPAYEEDRDICWQALKAGYRLVFEPKSIVNHIHETTNKFVFGKRRIQFYSMKNQLLFIWKNISSPKLIFQHILWLPYHLIITSIRTKGMFLVAFAIALCQLPKALVSRSRASKLWRKSDEEVLRMA